MSTDADAPSDLPASQNDEMNSTGDGKKGDNKDHSSPTGATDDLIVKVKYPPPLEPYYDDDDYDLDYTQSDVSAQELSVNVRRWHSLESQQSRDTIIRMETQGEKWSNWCDFFWTASSSTVGLGNIWRFPMVAAKHGGGAFLIPYLIVTILIGYPMVNLEFNMGQFMSHGPLRIWEMAPICRGVGLMVIMVNIVTASFYNVIIGWCLNYFVYSFYNRFPWTVRHANQSLQEAAQDFFDYKHLGLPKKPQHLQEFTNGVGLDGPPQWNLVVGLVAGWILIWALLMVGLKISGKASYFLGVFPIVYLTFLLGASFSLEGAAEGVKLFYKADWTQLGNWDTWFEATSQSFFSLNVGFGEMMMIASYKEFGPEVNSDTFFVILLDTLVSVLAGMSLYSLMGNLAHMSNTTAQEVLDKAFTKDEGFGVAFVTFPQVITSFGDYPGPQFFAASFFLMLVIVSVGSGTGFVNVVVGGITDYFPKANRLLMTTIMCVILCLTGLVYCCPNGLELFSLVNDFGSSYIAFVVVFLQTTSVAWIYGLKNFANDMEFMTNTKISRIKLFFWGVVCPGAMLSLFIVQLVQHKKKPRWPRIAEISAWTLFGFNLALVPFVAIIVIFTRKSKNCIKKLRASFRPTVLWGPTDPYIYKSWRRFKKQRSNEFKCTTTILFRCGCRRTTNSHHVDSHYSTAQPSVATLARTDTKTNLASPKTNNKQIRKEEEKSTEVSANNSTTVVAV